MSTVYDKEKNPLNPPSPQTSDDRGKSRYKDADCTEIDWFDSHPRPVVIPVSPALSIEIEAAIAGRKVVDVVRVGETGLNIITEPSAADLDANAEEERIRNATATSHSGDDVSPVQLPSGRSDEGLVAEPEVPQSTVPSEQPAGDVPVDPATGPAV